MRRWFLVLFTVHFFLSVGMFATGNIGAYKTEAGTASVAAGEPGTLDHLAKNGDLLGDAPDHGLTDFQPDLPDALQMASKAKPASQRVGEPAAPIAVDLTPPALDGLKRPPKNLA